MKDDRIELLRSGNIRKAVNKMATPAIIGLLVIAIYSMVDTMFVAWIGTNATGATQVVLPIMMLGSAIGLSFGIGGGSYISRLLGKGDYEEAEKVSSTAIFSSIAASILFTIMVFVFFEDVLSFFGADASVMSLAKDYGVYIVIGSVPLAINMSLNNILRAEGSSKLSMIAMVVGAVLNIFLDPLFIFGFGWGVQGAALGTLLSQTVTTIILVSIYVRSKTVVKIRLKSFRFSKKIYSEIFKVGTPTFVRQILFAISIGMLNTAAILHGGADMLAAIGIISRVMMVPTNVLFGMGQGFQPVAGYNIGANNKERLMEAFKYTAIASTVIAAITSLFFITFGEAIFSMFRATEAVSEFGVRGLKLYSLGVILLGVSNTITVFYQALGKGTEALIMSAARQGLVFIPLIIILPKFMGVDGVLSAQMYSDVITFVISIVLVIPFIKSDRINLTLAKAS